MDDLPVSRSSRNHGLGVGRWGSEHEDLFPVQALIYLCTREDTTALDIERRRILTAGRDRLRYQRRILTSSISPS